MFSSFFSCFPATASLSRTATMGKHAKSQLSSIISCCVLLLVLLYLAPTLKECPKVESRKIYQTKLKLNCSIVRGSGNHHRSPGIVNHASN